MNKIFWVDMEMTGLDPEQTVILEFAGIVTNLKLEALAQYQTVIYQPEEELAKMNQWNFQTHSGSGLLAQVPTGKPISVAEGEIIAFLKKHFQDEQPVLAGNSIHQDRKFIDRHMPKLAAVLHYRMIDVSSFKQVFRHFYHVNFKKENRHRAFDDITASINELKHYLKYVQLSPYS